jgi:hypothetical protein
VRRIFWLAVGLGAGGTAVVMTNRWARRQRERFAPANLGRQAGETLSNSAALAGQVWKAFQNGAEEREAEIRASLSDES